MDSAEMADELSVLPNFGGGDCKWRNPSSHPPARGSDLSRVHLLRVVVLLLALAFVGAAVVPGADA